MYQISRGLCTPGLEKQIDLIYIVFVEDTASEKDTY